MGIHVRMTSIALLCGLSVAACASNDKSGPSRTDSVRRGVADAATAPLRDVGLIRPDIPAPLVGLNYPYDNQNLLGGCPQVLYEIGRLDAVLGAETYQPGESRDRGVIERGGDAAADAAAGAVVGAAEGAVDIVPFRGLVRRASGASKAERELANAVEMGQTRRAFLRGYGSALGCLNVVPPPPEDREEREEKRPG